MAANDVPTEDRISKIMMDTRQVQRALQAGIEAALREHKLLGNPVCGMKDGKIVWFSPDQIPDKVTD